MKEDKNENGKKIPFSRERTPGEIVIARRKELGWTQEELSWMSGVSVTQISRLENDKSMPGFDTIEKLEQALGIQLLDIFTKFRKSMDPEKKSYLSTSDTLRNFERKLAKSGLSDEELEEVLGRVLNEAETKDGET